MKISVCIPVFNCDINQVVNDLNKEITTKNIDATIILIDDASEKIYQQRNLTAKEKVAVFHQLENNVGRSKIRNLFLNYSDSDFFIFLDCDVQMLSENFIENYCNAIKNYPTVSLFYGGFQSNSQQKQTLRNLYSEKRELTKKDDFSVFKTANFMVRRSVLEQYPFDEDITDYGYEDYIFARTLELANIGFKSIPNPVLHFDETSNIEFLKKVEISVKTLKKIAETPEKKIFIEKIKLYNAAQFLKKNRLEKPYLLIFKLFKQNLKKNLLSDKPNLKFLDLYKLGIFLSN